MTPAVAADCSWLRIQHVIEDQGGLANTKGVIAEPAFWNVLQWTLTCDSRLRLSR
jgi:hypothetical protein